MSLNCSRARIFILAFNFSTTNLMFAESNFALNFVLSICGIRFRIHPI